VSYSTDANLFNSTNAVTGPLSNPVAARPTLHEVVQGASSVELSWLAPEGVYVLQQNSGFTPQDWVPAFGSTYSSGRNVLVVGFDPFAESQFFRLISQ
jgi:hypothetical protein